MAKGNEVQLNLLPSILFLLENEHMVVEKLLELLIGVIDAELLEAIFLEDLKPGNIKNANEVRIVQSHTSSVQLAVYAGDQIAKPLFVDTLGQCIDRQLDLLRCLNLFYPFSSSLHSRMKKSLQ